MKAVGIWTWDRHHAGRTILRQWKPTTWCIVWRRRKFYAWGILLGFHIFFLCSYIIFLFHLFMCLNFLCCKSIPFILFILDFVSFLAKTYGQKRRNGEMEVWIGKGKKIQMSKGAFNYGARMSKRGLEMEPIEIRNSTFVKWRPLESFEFFWIMRDHGKSWDVVGKSFVMFLFIYRTYRRWENLVEGLWKFCEKMERFLFYFSMQNCRVEGICQWEPVEK